MTYQQPHPQPQYYVPLPPPAPSNGPAVTALVFGIVAIVIGVWSIIPIFGFIAAFLAALPAILAVVFGHVGFSRSKLVGVGKNAAVSGLVLGYVTIALIVFTTFGWVMVMSA